MSGHQQLDKLKGHALIFSDEVRDLILGFQMLVPIAQDEQLLKRFPAPTSARYANCAWLSHWGMHYRNYQTDLRLRFSESDCRKTRACLLPTVQSD